MTTDDNFVEKLLSDLPKAPPMSDLDIKRFENHIDSLVAAENRKISSKNWSNKFSVAASIVALVAGVAIFANNSKIINPQQFPTIAPSALPSNSATDGGAIDEAPEFPQSSGKDSSHASSSGATTYGNSHSPKPDELRGSIPVLNFGFDYEADEQAARSKVKQEAQFGDTKLMKSSQIACSLKLGIDQELYAIDRGTYSGEDVEAYYFGANKNSLKIKIVGFGCVLIKDL